ncbi:hypothetical protein TVAG_171010 [Trichomonas vaginalis G3]|uniref:Uncharacterized protein n=1 Tax=Trichomonas vaginalis (strain ATCC PRA-98 / G3) TaxID=412133 RepID=A2FIP1_TRIV3|nr:hypothetical protein TVAG_171010 [Trichomonas vaginalis G3]|eukprot:XP_001308143.1 hypothetical protein [Trichomonas vaginalis G3]
MTTCPAMSDQRITISGFLRTFQPGPSYVDCEKGILYLKEMLFQQSNSKIFDVVVKREGEGKKRKERKKERKRRRRRKGKEEEEKRKKRRTY